MNKAQLKQIIALVLLVAGCMAAVTVTGRFGRVVQLAESGADSAGALTELAVPVDPADIDWTPDPPLPRAMENETRRAIGEAYLLSLALLDGTLSVDSIDDLAVLLTGPALEAARTAAAPVPPRGRSHQMQVIFYSADGQLVEIEDRTTRVVALDGASALTRTEQAVAVLVRIDGIWHLRHRLVEAASSDFVGGTVITEPSTNN